MIEDDTDSENLLKIKTVNSLVALLCNKTNHAISISKCPIFYAKDGNFESQNINETTVQLSCLRNFRYVSGSNVRVCLVDGHWSGEDFKCELEPYMERYILSGCIVISAFLLSFVLFGLDFCYFMRKKRTIRVDMRRKLYTYMAKFNQSTEYKFQEQCRPNIFHKLQPPFTPDTHTKIFNLSNLSQTSLPLSPALIETGPKDFWILRSMFKSNYFFDTTNNKRKEHVHFKLHGKRSSVPISSRRATIRRSEHKVDNTLVPIEPDYYYQGMGLRKAIKRLVHREEEFLGVGRPEVRSKRATVKEDKATKKSLFLTMKNFRHMPDGIDERDKPIDTIL